MQVKISNDPLPLHSLSLHDRLTWQGFMSILECDYNYFLKYFYVEMH
jgi:hypothetical protein